MDKQVKITTGYESHFTITKNEYGTFSIEIANGMGSCIMYIDRDPRGNKSDDIKVIREIAAGLLSMVPAAKAPKAKKARAKK